MNSERLQAPWRTLAFREKALDSTLGARIVEHASGIIASKASGRDCTNNNELLHKIGVLQRYAMHLFVFTRELYNRFDGAVSKTVVPRETDNKVEGSSPYKSFFIFFLLLQICRKFFVIYMFAEKSMFDVLCTCKSK